MTDTTESTEVEPIIKTAVERLNQGISYQDLLALVAPPPTPVVIPEVLPVPAEITDAQREALDRLPEVFGRVVPLERRVLAPVEVTALLIERATLTEIEKMAEERKADIRTTVLNHNDVTVEEQFDVDEVDGFPRNEQGHYVIAGEVRGEVTASSKFTAETRKGGVSIDPKVIQVLADDPAEEWISHEDYLAMTRSERVFDENKTMLHLKKRPELVRAIREATVSGRPTVAVYQRKA